MCDQFPKVAMWEEQGNPSPKIRKPASLLGNNVGIDCSYPLSFPGFFHNAMGSRTQITHFCNQFITVTIWKYQMDKP